jgi:hypothetical protein
MSKKFKQLQQKYIEKKLIEKNELAPKLTKEFFLQLVEIQPQTLFFIKKKVFYYPCSVELITGQIEKCVYLLSVYANEHCFWLKKENQIQLDQIKCFFPSKYRLPYKFAEQILKHGETGMGYVSGSFEMTDEKILNWISHESLEFPELPNEYLIQDIKNIKIQRIKDNDLTTIKSKPYKIVIYRE